MGVLLLDAVTTAAILFAVASGLMIILGVMKLINFAHGAFLTIGGYAALVVTQFGWNAWLAAPFAALVGLVLGVLIERLVIRPLYARPLDAILATWGLGIVIGQLITIGFGREVQFVQSPVSGAIPFLGQSYSLYRLLLVVIAVALGGALAALLYFTRFGLDRARGDHERGSGARARHRQRQGAPRHLRPRRRARQHGGRPDHAAARGRAQHGPAVAGQLFHAGAGIRRLDPGARGLPRSFWAAPRWWSALTSARSSAA